ncbi:UDP-N-acetylmuramoyl-L-alanyl-D-glutamate--2,6-diaminopimelate ligase [Simkania negevensis]|nr:UDP-N-acetylmuramoyl-L-alanyl-D-glutamate--2,6-diaminopimelate ligase [Simkania negevensis]
MIQRKPIGWSKLKSSRICMGNGITVKKLFQGLDVEIKGCKDLEVTGVCSHSKFVAPGNLFIAKKGTNFDATEFIPDAASAGATAILTDLYNPFLEGPAQVIHPHPDRIEAEIADRFFRYPSQELFLIGITGTNGKTTTSYLIHHLLTRKESPCGLMGTIETMIGQHRIPSELTTADIVTNQKFLREMRDQGAENGVMEVTSHALEQGRVAGLDFDMAIFTNFSQDHLDYHGTMENYLAAKAKLFKIIDAPEKIAVLNADDAASLQAFGASRAKAVTFGIESPADYQAKGMHRDLEGTSFILAHQGKERRFKIPLIGDFNVLNALAAIAACHQRGLTFEQIQRRLATFPGIPGRLERIQNDRGIHLFVDFAHTPEALEKVLSLLTQVKEKKILTIFGCGGDRDPSKRPKMAAAVEKFSDHVILTSDNPRSEDPMEICLEAAKGIRETRKLLIEVDRKAAIAKGIELAKPGDVVLLAGRGHEPFQKIGGRLIPFDDREVAREICSHSP